MKRKLYYLSHSYDANLVIRISVNIKDIQSISIHKAVLHLRINAFVQVFSNHAAHSGADGSGLQHTHLIMLWHKQQREGGEEKKNQLWKGTENCTAMQRVEQGQPQRCIACRESLVPFPKLQQRGHLL